MGQLYKIPNDTEINNHRSPYGFQSPYRIVSYKRPRNDNVNNSNEKTNDIIYEQIMNEKQNV